MALLSPSMLSHGSHGQRRLSTRQGSISASDPWAKSAHLHRTSSSTLTIVRVPSSPSVPHDQPSSPGLPFSRLHKRNTSNPSTPDPSPPTGRLSFAFSSFAGPGAATGGPATGPASGTPSDGRLSSPSTSPSTSPNLRPSSPRRHSSSFTSLNKPRLSPDQLFDLARQSTTPRYTPSNSPLLGRSNSPLGLHSPTLPPSDVAPATFTPLPDDIFLPFIDRPTEVSALLASSPSSKLFALLAQTFPTSSSPPDTPSAPTLPEDPTTWSFPHLAHWLTKTDRATAPDPLWVLNARKCILSHSELLWERIKSALGVPPELDIDLDPEDIPASPDTADISDDEGRKARGHWEDWDAVMDSPVFDRRMGVASGFVDSPVTTRRHDVLFNFHLDSRLHTYTPSDPHVLSTLSVPPVDGDTTISPTPTGASTGSPPSDGKANIAIAIPHGTPRTMSWANTPYRPSHVISIEPLLAASSPSTSNPPPLSLHSSLSSDANPGLGDIAEGAEDEEPDTPSSKSTPTSPHGDPQDTNPDPNPLVDPTQIQGLRISTSPHPRSPTPTSMPILSPLGPVSPLPPYPRTTPPVSSASSSLGSGSGSGSGFHRSPSFGSMSTSMSMSQGVYGYADADVPYDPVGDRGPGNPLFPSNFARLAVGPTLSANNPSLRSPIIPPLSQYTRTHAHAHTYDQRTGTYSGDGSSVLPTSDVGSGSAGSGGGGVE